MPVPSLSSITELTSQHVMEHGKPHERSAIIEKLIGQIVQMSQQKFASNVIEKCLSFGNPVERQILIGEMLGSMEESEHLEVCCPSICRHICLVIVMQHKVLWYLLMTSL